MLRFIRILPLTIFVAVLFFIVKVLDVSEGTEALFVSRSMAEENKKEPEKEDGKKEEEKKKDTKEDKKEDKKEEKKDEKKEEHKSEEKKSEGAEGEGKEKEKVNPAVSATPGDVTSRHFSKSEIDLLQSLARRRADLERWERNIQVKEEVLNATEKRINEKIEQIEAMKKAVAEVLAQYNTQEDARVKSLVKIYEAMKPDDAARIFDEIEMPVLLLVIDKMAEKKAAPILAKMDPKKAKQITVELAEQRRLNMSRAGAAKAPQ